MIMHAFK
jgi:hypothetical protein